MNLLRILISVALVALGAIWTVREHLEKPYFEVQVELIPNTPKTLDGWERRALLKGAWNEFSSDKGWEVERTRTGYSLNLSEEERYELNGWLEDWNSAELSRAQLLDGEFRRKQNLKAGQIERLNQRRTSLEKLNEDLKELEKKAPEWSKKRSNLDLSKFLGTSSPAAKAKEAKTVESNVVAPSTDVTGGANIFGTIGDDPETLFRQRLSTEVNRAQSFLSQGQKDLEEKLLEGQTDVVNRIALRLASQEQRLLTLLEQQLQSLENQDRHWEESRGMIGLLLGDQLAGLELELASLRQWEIHAPAKATLNLTEKEIEAPAEALRDSFRFFLLGMVICFIFNLLWEMVVQRDRL